MSAYVRRKFLRNYIQALGTVNFSVKCSVIADKKKGEFPHPKAPLFIRSGA